MSAFFVRTDTDTFTATGHTRGPWSPDFQHGSPPMALVAHVAMQVVARTAPHLRLARFGCDLLRPVPVGALRVEVQPQKLGQHAGIVDATLFARKGEQDTAVLRARMGLVRGEAAPELDTLPDAQVFGVGPDAATPFAFPTFPGRPQHGERYAQAMELRLAQGTFMSGRTAMWMRAHQPLVQGEAQAPETLVLLCADAGSGVSMGIDPARTTFLNSDLTVHFVRPPQGEWLLLDAQTTTGPLRRALATTALSDVYGGIGTVLQTLVLQPASSS